MAEAPQIFIFNHDMDESLDDAEVLPVRVETVTDDETPSSFVGKPLFVLGAPSARLDRCHLTSAAGVAMTIGVVISTFVAFDPTLPRSVYIGAVSALSNARLMRCCCLQPMN